MEEKNRNMITLNLINPAESGIVYQLKTLPDGEPQIMLQTIDLCYDQPCKIITRLSSPNDILLLLFAKNALEYAGFSDIELCVSYLLTARMDRQMHPGEAFSLKVVATLINNSHFKKVSVFDAHSDVTAAVIDNCSIVSNEVFVQDSIKAFELQNPTVEKSKFCLVSPDAGALKKIYKVAQSISDIEVVECIKNRNPHTGKLSGFKVFSKELRGRVCFLVDDICDSGRTIVGVAAALKELHAEKIIFIVSHGIFSKGIPLQNVDEIFCTDSYKPLTSVKGELTVMNVLKYLS